MRNMRLSVYMALVVAVSSVSPARGDLGSFFDMPVEGALYISAAGGFAGGVTAFGTGTSQADFVALITGLPGSPAPVGEVLVGQFLAGTAINFGMRTVFSGTHYAFSNDTISAGAQTTFMDLNNSLGFGGSVVQQTATNMYLLHLDDAASFLVDDDDNDVLIALRVAPGVVPEPAMAAGLGAVSLLLVRRSVRR